MGGKASGREGEGLKRWIAVLLLVAIASILSAAGSDHCHEDSAGHTHESQHVLCLDDCMPILIPDAPTAPPPDPLPKPTYEAVAVHPTLVLDPEPEKAPPRG